MWIILAAKSRAKFSRYLGFKYCRGLWMRHSAGGWSHLLVRVRPWGRTGLLPGHGDSVQLHTPARSGTPAEDKIFRGFLTSAVTQWRTWRPPPTRPRPGATRRGWRRCGTRVWTGGRWWAVCGPPWHSPPPTTSWSATSGPGSWPPGGGTRDTNHYQPSQ